MSDAKSSLPDLKELGSMVSKFLKDMKVSVGQIIDEYKEKHGQSCDAKTCKSEPAAEVKATRKPRAKAKTDTDSSK